MPEAQQPESARTGTALAEPWLSLRSLLSWFLGGLVLLGTSLSTLVLVPFVGIARLYPLLKGASALILRICGIRFKITGREHLDPNRAYLYMGNHVNLFDSLFILLGIPQQIVGVEKDTHFSWPVYGALIRSFGNIPVSQANTEKARESIRKAVETFRRGVSVVILPEGTRTRSGRTGEFKKGGFHLAIDAGATIVPFTILGAYEINATPGWKIKPGAVELIFHAPIPATDYDKDRLEALRDRVRATIVAPLEAGPA